MDKRNTKRDIIVIEDSDDEKEEKASPPRNKRNKASIEVEPTKLEPPEPHHFDSSVSLNIIKTQAKSHTITTVPQKQITPLTKQTTTTPEAPPPKDVQSTEETYKPLSPMEHKHAVRILNDHAQAVVGQTEDSLYFKVQWRDGQEELVRGDLVSILLPSRVQEYARRCSSPIFPSHSLPSSCISGSSSSSFSFPSSSSPLKKAIEEIEEDDPLLLLSPGCSFSSFASALSPSSSSPATACPAASSNSPSIRAETTHAVALSAASSISPRSSPSSSASDSSPLLGSGFKPDTNLRWSGGVWAAWVLFKWPATNEETSIGSKVVWRSLNALRDSYFQQCGRPRPEPVTRGNVSKQLTCSSNGNVFAKTLKAGRQTYYLLPFETLPPRFQTCIRSAIMEEVIVLRNRDSFVLTPNEEGGMAEAVLPMQHHHRQPSALMRYHIYK